MKKTFWQRFFGHLHTINKHKITVMKHCFKLGLYKRGLLHDLSKYSPVEFWAGVRYFQGDKSPNNVQRDVEGVAKAWLHHKGRNKHHYEYWIDYTNDRECEIGGSRMPTEFVLEMFCDRVAASKVYKKDEYTEDAPLAYYMRGKGKYVMHPQTAELLEKLLRMLAEQGEDATFAYIRKEILGKKR